MEITSVQNKLVKEMTKLHKKKYRDESNLFLVEGYHLYEEALKMGNIKTVFTTDRSIKGTNVHYVSQNVLEKLAQMKSPQGIVSICEKINKGEVKNKVLLLDRIQDPGNLGTLIRSALAFGFETVVMDNTVDLYNDKALRSTQGAMYQLNIIEKDAITFFNENKEHVVYGTAFNGVSLKELKPSEKVIVCLGNEGSGVRKEILDYAYENITIETNKVDSLNVGVAGSIIMHELKGW